MFSSVDSVLSYIREHSIKFVDFRFTDVLGKWHHITRSVAAVNVDVLSSGVMFDSSSIVGWKPVQQSDMVILPDISTAFVDPFTAHPTIVIICDVIDPEIQLPYSRDPRSTACRAEQYAKDLGVADKVYFGPEMEFFVFEDVRFHVGMNSSYFELDSNEGLYNSGRKYESGNMGHRPKAKGGYMPVSPVDSSHDLRSEMLEMLSEVGLVPLLHHHEVSPAQCEIGFQYSEFLKSADNVQKCKYVVHNVAASYGKSATFMPKPMKGDNGSGMHCHQSLWKNGVNLFAGNDGLISETCLYYIGGIIKHGRAISAFANPTTNSYKRLVPNYEAPVWLSYSYGNRSAAVRIPLIPGNNNEARRIEVRFPDPAANPYLCFAAQLMAGLDGIKNKIHPGEAINENFYTLEKSKLQKFDSLSKSLGEALKALNDDRSFLVQGNAFTNDQIDAYIKIKMSEIEDIDTNPHPVEFINYYSC